MEVDTSDIDYELLNRLTTMSTRDKEDILAQFQSIVGNQMSPGCCSFYLEMGNWNLQTALGAYYDIMSSPERYPAFEVSDESLHTDEHSLSPNQTFMKTWRIRNIGQESWNDNLRLRFVKGQNFGHAEHVVLPPTAPNEITDISIAMKAPAEDGLFHSQWRIITSAGTYCGSPLFVTVMVESKNIASLTEQMSSLGSEETDISGNHSLPISTPFRPAIAATPFCSPTGYGIFGGNSVPTNVINRHLPGINETNLRQLMQRNNLLSEFNAADQQSDPNSRR